MYVTMTDDHSTQALLNNAVAAIQAHIRQELRHHRDKRVLLIPQRLLIDEVDKDSLGYVLDNLNGMELPALDPGLPRPLRPVTFPQYLYVEDPVPGIEPFGVYAVVRAPGLMAAVAEETVRRIRRILGPLDLDHPGVTVRLRMLEIADIYGPEATIIYRRHLVKLIRQALAAEAVLTECEEPITFIVQRTR